MAPFVAPQQRGSSLKKAKSHSQKNGVSKNTKIGDGDGRCPAQKKCPPISLNKKVSVSIFFENATVHPWY
jgi:hypothetical protein